MNRRSFIASSAAVIGAGWARREAFGTSYDRVPPEGAVYDVVVYGATASGVIAAVTAARQGLQTVLLEPGRRVGGMVSGGLGWTDFATSDDGAVIGGFAREFFSRVGRFYGAERTRRFNESVGNPRLGDVGWYFEPHVAENIMRQMLEEAGVVTSFGSRLRQTMAVKKNHTNVSEILLDNGRSYQGRVFIDATYEGDLMAQAGIAYTVGRETRSTYDEPLAGVLKANRDVALASSRQQAMPAGTSAYNSPGKLIVGVVPAPSQALGSADRKVQAYCFRLCLTKTPDNRIPFSRPEGYNPAQYELHARVMHAMQANDNNRPPTLRRFLKNSSIPNGKTDSNNQGPASTDFVNASWEYP
ncbi:MAG: FAD-dependent oxidoreductase, partial [Candidatus Binataceae bacterium]